MDRIEPWDPFLLHGVHTQLLDEIYERQRRLIGFVIFASVTAGMGLCRDVCPVVCTPLSLSLPFSSIPHRRTARELDITCPPPSDAAGLRLTSTSTLHCIGDLPLFPRSEDDYDVHSPLLSLALPCLAVSASPTTRGEAWWGRVSAPPRHRAGRCCLPRYLFVSRAGCLSLVAWGREGAECGA